MMWGYQLLDITITIVEMFGLVITSLIFLQKPRYRKNVCLSVSAITMFAVVFMLTWFTSLGSLKMPIYLLIAILLSRCLYRDSMVMLIAYVELWFINTCLLPESVTLSLGHWFCDGQLTTTVTGEEILKWQIMLLGIAIKLFCIVIFYAVSRNFRYEIKKKDLVVLTIDFVIVFSIFFLPIYSLMNLQTAELNNVLAVVTVLGFAFMLHFLNLKNTIFLREEKKADEFKIEKLQQQFAYYQEKQKDEEKVRSIYHDMKNHLLVLEGSQGTDATRKMAEQLRTQIADYEDYIHTGNNFLDVIIKDKAEKMHEKQIDFSVSIDFDSVDFIEPLDISTLFGNGIDNAMEASEKLPEEQRVVLVKAGKVQSFVSVLIENNCLDTNSSKQIRTTKADSFLHGFGISNMEKAAEKYGGTCTIAQENGKFTLKILIPIP